MMIIIMVVVLMMIMMIIQFSYLFIHVLSSIASAQQQQ